jgi:hydantoinase/carbamoylase family amidase
MNPKNIVVASIIAILAHVGLIVVALGLDRFLNFTWETERDGTITTTLWITWGLIVLGVLTAGMTLAAPTARRRQPQEKITTATTAVPTLPVPLPSPRHALSGRAAELTPLALQVERNLESIGAIGRNQPGKGWTRLAFSKEEEAVHQLVRAMLQKQGFAVTKDAFGNLHARRSVSPDAPRVLLATHLDTVPEGGNFDGVVGFVAAYQVARRVADLGLAVNLDIGVFRGEESSRFEKSTLGSRAAFGVFNVDDLDGLRDTLVIDGTATLRHALVKNGLDPAKIGPPSLNVSDYDAYLEVHIEQARVLEQKQALGVVTSIRAAERRLITVSGAKSVQATAAMICAVERLAEQGDRSGLDVVATVGRVQNYFTGANKINAIPGHISVGVTRNLTANEWREVCQCAAKRGVAVESVSTPDGMELTFTGVTDHSGGTPMGWKSRKDALAAASESISLLPDELVPPVLAIKFYLDLRSNSVRTRQAVFEQIHATWRDTAVKHGVQVCVDEPTEQSRPVTALDPELQDLLMSAGHKLDLKMVRLPSGAGHDAMIAAQAGIPTAMLFVPSIDGLSHCPQERTRISDIVKAIHVVVGTLEALANKYRDFPTAAERALSQNQTDPRPTLTAGTLRLNE